MHVKVKCPICGQEHTLFFNIVIVENKTVTQNVICPYTNEFYTITITLKVSGKATFSKEELQMAEMEEKIRESKWKEEEEYGKNM